MSKYESFPVDVVLGDSIDVKRWIKNRKLGGDLNVPNYPHNLLHVVIVKFVSNLLWWENGFGKEPESSEKLFVNWYPLESYSSWISDFDVFDVYRVNADINGKCYLLLVGG